MISLLSLYQQDCQNNNWIENPSIIKIIEEISLTYDVFSQKESWLHRFFKPSFLNSPSPLSQGIYLNGPVGRGKTYVMDLFFYHQPQKNKARWHFTEFMQLIHHLLSHFSHHSSGKHKGQPIQCVARHLSHTYKLICLDEFQVTEIAEAMILYRLFSHLIQEGLFFIVTSNCAPHDLYKNGLHFDRFEPFIHLIEKKWRTITFDHQGDDYRRLSQKEKKKKDPTHNTLLKYQHLYETFEMQEGRQPAHFQVNDRSIFFPHATPSTLWISFSDSCKQPYGPAEYQAIAKKFKRVFLTHVPLLSPHNRDAARRFITFIDCLYDEGVTVYLHSVTDPDHLYTETGPQALPFARTASRLIQMNSQINL